MTTAIRRPTKKPKLKVYKVSIYKTGAIYFIKARTKFEAEKFAKDDMINEYGKIRSIDSITEVTPEDRENYPFVFKKPRLSTIGVRRKNPTSKSYLLPLVIASGLVWLLLKNK